MSDHDRTPESGANPSAEAHKSETPAKRTPEHDGHLVGWASDADRLGGPLGFSSPGAEPEAVDDAGAPILFADEGHLLTIAPTGAGKGVGCIIPTLLRYPGPVIVIDPKGENAAVTARQRRALGQEVHVVDPMGVTNEHESYLNPLDHVDTRFEDCTDNAQRLAMLLCPDGTHKELFWQGHARALITAFILHACADYPKGARNIKTVREIAYRAFSEPQAVADEMERSNHPEPRAAAKTLRNTEPRLMTNIMSCVLQPLEVFAGESLDRAMSRSSFDLDRVTRGDPLSIYLVMPPHMLSTHAVAMRLWVGALMGAILDRRRRPARRTLFLLDEAAQLGELNELRQALTLMRGYGLQTWSFWQDASQLTTLYSDADTLINNCRVVQAFGAPNHRAAKAAAELVGIPDAGQVFALKPDEMILLVAHEEPKVVRKPSYLRDPIFAGLADPNPYHDEDGVLPPRRRRTPCADVLRDPDQRELRLEEPSRSERRTAYLRRKVERDAELENMRRGMRPPAFLRREDEKKTHAKRRFAKLLTERAAEVKAQEEAGAKAGAKGGKKKKRKKKKREG